MFEDKTRSWSYRVRSWLGFGDAAGPVGPLSVVRDREPGAHAASPNREPGRVSRRRFKPNTSDKTVTSPWMEPLHPGAVVFGSMRHDTHHATTDRFWVRMVNHEIAPWVAVDDLGNVICMRWDHLVVTAVQSRYEGETVHDA